MSGESLSISFSRSQKNAYSHVPVVCDNQKVRISPGVVYTAPEASVTG